MIHRGIDWTNFDANITKNFKVGEVSNNEVDRIVSDPRIADECIYLAQQLQKARDFIGQAIRITSWYRPPAINRRIGGAPRSQHLTGRAADLYCPALSHSRLLQYFIHNWDGYLFSYPQSGFLHVDTRVGTGWVPHSKPAYFEVLE